ncbi:MAG: 30S ribosomal protein S4 [Candidatus Taylorbacteria bacterium RIFCSPLOWO2_01_FULL_45_15b]|uniref:Small ribosomal subunit protein uS4 n=1 Tax=Candidatus Taylorbacteria bacterium RIFCSPLOWO2_01_FULL_45_15b TaxID=1802319 RepID=A0A1G2NAC0_9BACT|nr:MAG: 30S ribosomal protein S4 [Candidatus Taylorbacteria bacterium RIFCSPLOWO2_01_FULL_45_15b]
MKLGPRYKIARRLGANIFDKTQTEKFQAREMMTKKGKRPGARSEFGLQLLEKQKARFMYGVTERQFSTYVKKAIAKKGVNSSELLIQFLEMRLDNVVYRLGLAPSRRAARQMVSHGHIFLNGKKITVPSAHVSEKDSVTIREQSEKSGLFTNLQEKLKTATPPVWIKADSSKGSAEIISRPKYESRESIFDIDAILEFYKRS